MKPPMNADSARKHWGTEHTEDIEKQFKISLFSAFPRVHLRIHCIR
jgi:hypothetical protein